MNIKEKLILECGNTITPRLIEELCGSTETSAPIPRAQAEKPEPDLADKLAAAVERHHGGCVPWPATQRRHLAQTLRAILVDEMVGTEWEVTLAENTRLKKTLEYTLKYTLADSSAHRDARQALSEP